MAQFKYSVVNGQGQRINGVKEAESEAELTEYLYSQGYTIISIDEKIGIDLKALANTEIGGLPIGDRVILVKQLATMITAGIPLLQALDILIQQTEKESLKEKLQRIYKMVQAGTSLSDSFKREPGIFNEVQINLLAAGEKSGNLNEILQKIAIDLEKTKNL